MKKLVLLFSHNLTKEQIRDAKENLEISSFIYLPDSLQNKWSNFEIDDNDGVEEIKEYIRNNATIGDYILIQGEYGLVFKMVNWSLNNGYIPIYSYTKRAYKNEELIDGTIKNIHYFKHICYREYTY